jgi:hypothetical protein
MESLRASLSQITPIPTGRILELQDDEINDANPVKTEVHKETYASDDEHGVKDKDIDKDKDGLTLLEIKDNCSQDDILTKIMEDDQKKMFEQNWIQLKIIFAQRGQWKEERTRMLFELNRSRATDRPQNGSNQYKMFKMVDPLRYCSLPKELDKFLETLSSNFASHKHLFRRGNPNHVKYVVSFLNTCNNNPDLTE